MNYFRIIVVSALLFTATSNTEAQSITEESLVVQNESISVQKTLMVESLLQKLTVWVRPFDGKRIYAYNCRSLRYGCAAQVEAFVEYIFDVSIDKKFDPWLLAGIAWHESAFHPFAESHAGAVGILQLLRRSRWSRGLPFVHQSWYRKRCRRILGSCQRPIVERSVFWLKRSFNYCRSVEKGLRLYNSGRCDGPKKYPRRVFFAKKDIVKRARKYLFEHIHDFGPRVP